MVNETKTADKVAGKRPGFIEEAILTRWEKAGGLYALAAQAARRDMELGEG